MRVCQCGSFGGGSGGGGRRLMPRLQHVELRARRARRLRLRLSLTLPCLDRFARGSKVTRRAFLLLALRLYLL